MLDIEYMYRNPELESMLDSLLKEKHVLQKAKEILDFVLKECSDIQYDVFNGPNRNDVNIIIKKDFDLQRLYFAYTLLKEEGISIDTLTLYGLEIDELPDDILEMIEINSLEISNNRLKTLPKLPNTLQSLYCVGNLIEDLPQLPQSLVVLYCGNNLLRELPKLPETLCALNCFKNKLTTLPNVPTGLELVNFKKNKNTLRMYLKYKFKRLVSKMGL